MSPAEPARLMRIHISEADRFGDKPLYEAIVEKCREMKIAGATVFRGLEGYGETADLHKAHLTGHNQPVVIAVADTAAQIAQLAAAVEAMMKTGVLAVLEVRMIRVHRGTQ